MKHPERSWDYLDHIVQAIERAAQYARTAGSLAGLEKSALLQDAIVRTIAVIGEAVNRIQKENPVLVAEHPEIPWPLMRGMRNKIVHDYFDETGPSFGIRSSRICPVYCSRFDHCCVCDRAIDAWPFDYLLCPAAP